MHRFTSEFGMGSGGSNALLPPGKPFEARSAENVLNLIQDLLTLVKRFYGFRLSPE
jgi:hypothetical protein